MFKILGNMIASPFYDVDDGAGADLGDLEILGEESTEEGAEEKTEEKEIEDDVKELAEDESEDEDEDTSDDDESEDEDEEAESDEDKDKDEEDEPVGDGRISIKALKAQYPDIFKKNPELKSVIFQHREFTKVYGTIDDAREAKDKSDAFDNFEATILNGSIGELIDAVAEHDQNAAVKIADNFLPELFARSRQLFARVTQPVVKGMLRSIYTRAQNKGDKNLTLACQYISRDLFETPDVIKATEIEEREEDPREKEIDNKKQELFQQQVNTAKNDVLKVVTNRIAKEVNSRLGANLSPFVKEALIEKITNELDRQLYKDKAHQAHLSSLWRKMAKAGFSSEAKSQIISASWGRAKRLLPGTIARVKAQQKDKGKGTKAKEIPNQTVSKTRAASPGKLTKEMSDYEFLSK